MYSFLKKHPLFVTFGFSTFFFTVLGQTYFLAFFNPSILASTGLTQVGLGQSYSLATLFSACFLPFMGHLNDKLSLKALLTLVILGLGLGLVGLGSLEGIKGPTLAAGILFFSYFLIRLMGQVSLGMIPSVALSRVFGKHRGKVLSLSFQGRFLADGVIPASVVFLVGLLGHRYALWSFAAFIICLLLPFLLFLISKLAMTRPLYEEAHVSTKPYSEEFWPILRRPLVLTMFFIHLFNPLVMTGLFFHQNVLLSEKGWDPAIWASSFFGLSLGQILSGLASGYLIDRFSASYMIRFSLIPVSLCLLLLGYEGQSWSAFFALFFAGVTIGAGSPINHAFWAENFHLSLLGKIKGIDSAIMVLGTSAAPLLVAYFLEAGSSMTTLLRYSVLLLLFAVFLSTLLSLSVQSSKKKGKED